MPDALKAAVELMCADPSRLRHRNSFNIASMSFEPEQLFAKIRECEEGLGPFNVLDLALYPAGYLSGREHENLVRGGEDGVGFRRKGPCLGVGHFIHCYHEAVQLVEVHEEVVDHALEVAVEVPALR